MLIESWRVILEERNAQGSVYIGIYMYENLALLLLPKTLNEIKRAFQQIEVQTQAYCPRYDKWSVKKRNAL